MKVIFNVTKEAIKNGRRLDGKTPIHLVTPPEIRKEFWMDKDWTTGWKWGFSNFGATYLLPEKAAKWMDAWDVGEPVKPISFEIDFSAYFKKYGVRK